MNPNNEETITRKFGQPRQDEIEENRRKEQKEQKEKEEKNKGKK